MHELEVDEVNVQGMGSLLPHEVPVLYSAYLGHLYFAGIEYVIACDFVEDPFGSIDHGFHATQDNL